VTAVTVVTNGGEVTPVTSVTPPQGNGGWGARRSRYPGLSPTLSTRIGFLTPSSRITRSVFGYLLLALVGIHSSAARSITRKCCGASSSTSTTRQSAIHFHTSLNGVGTQPADGPGGWLFTSTGAPPANPNTPRTTPNGTTLDPAAAKRSVPRRCARNLRGVPFFRTGLP